jgi:hypothetical protein
MRLPELGGRGQSGRVQGQGFFLRGRSPGGLAERAQRARLREPRARHQAPRSCAAARGLSRVGPWRGGSARRAAGRRGGLRRAARAVAAERRRRPSARGSAQRATGQGHPAQRRRALEALQRGLLVALLLLRPACRGGTGAAMRQGAREVRRAWRCGQRRQRPAGRRCSAP